MDEQETQKSCWGVATWAIAVFLTVFVVFSMFDAVEPDAVVTVSEQ